MNDLAAAAASADALPPAPPQPVDRDKGETYGSETLTLVRPFKLGGTLRQRLDVRVPDGDDVAAHIDPSRGRRDGVGLMLALAGLDGDALDGMYAFDRTALDRLIGRHMMTARPAPPVPATVAVDRDAGEGYGRDVVAMTKPFRHKGQVYSEITFRVPTGRDVARYVDVLPAAVVSTALMADLSELSPDVFGKMYARDRAACEAAVGKHL